MMKKLVIFAVLLSLLTLTFAGCGTAKHFTGEWKFSKIVQVELGPNADEVSIDNLKAQYDVEDEASLVVCALADFKESGIFAPCYIHFDKKHTYTYDPALDREATWVFYKTGENTGFISFYTELDATEGNPDPTLFPDIVYNAETDTMLMTIQYRVFMVTIELSR